MDPAPGPTLPLAIVDGVRRVELRVLTDVEGRTHHGLFGSAAVGAARLDARAEIADVRVARFLVMGGGLVAGDAVIEPLRRRQTSSVPGTTTPAGRPRHAAGRSGTVQGPASSPGTARTDGRDVALRFTGIAVAENTAMAPLTGLQEQMRAAEGALAERLAGQAGDRVIVDGPLQPLRRRRG